MARIRSIKPEFFQDEDLNDLPLESHFLFGGLFGLGDCEGRMEDRPRTIKMSVFPHRDKITPAKVDEFLNLLAKPKPSGIPFIVRYLGPDGRAYIQIVNFSKHQRISGKESEQDSIIPPPPPTTGSNGEALGKQRGSTGEVPIAQEGKGKEVRGKRVSDFSAAEAERHFEAIWKLYPSPKGKKKAKTHFIASVKNQGDLESIQRALKNYKANLAKNKTAPKYIQNGSTWFNNWEDWTVDVDPLEIVQKAVQERTEAVRATTDAREREALAEKARADAAHAAALAALRALPAADQERIRVAAEAKIAGNRFLKKSELTLELEMVEIFRAEPVTAQ